MVFINNQYGATTPSTTNSSHFIPPTLSPHYSLIPITIAYVAGIGWAGVANVPVAFCWILVILLLTRLIIAIRRPKGLFTNYLILPLFFLIGGAHAAPHLSPPTDPHHIYHHLSSRQEATITGILIKAPEIGAAKTKLLIASEWLQQPHKATSVTGKILLSVKTLPPENIQPGDRIMARAQLSRPTSFAVPGAFNYQSFLALQSIWATGWVSSPYLITKVHTLDKPPIILTLFSLSERLRHKISIFIDSNLPSKIAGIYKALLIGDRSGIDTETAEIFKITGCFHLLAISGMHMSLLGFVIGALTIWLCKRSEFLLLRLKVWKTAAIITIPLLALYALIAGLHTPVLRALIMTYVFLGALILDRQGSVFNNIALAALVLLTINPATLFTVSFQLSFTAVLSIGFFYRKIITLLSLPVATNAAEQKHKAQSITKNVYNFIHASLLLSVAASLGTAPLLVYHFNRISLISPISTLLVEPFLCLWSLILGLLGCLSLPVPALAQLFFKGGSLGIIASLSISEFLAVPAASIWLPTPTPWTVTGIYILLVLIFCLSCRLGSLSNIRKIYIAIFIVFLSVTFLWIKHNRTKQSDQLEVAILDIGQGLATVLQLPDGQTFIIDSGRKQSRSGSFNVGRDLVAQFLWQNGISSLAGIIISHPHEDHYNGIPFLINTFHPQIVWVNTIKNDELGYRDLLATAQHLDIPVKSPFPGQYIFQSDHISLQSIADLHIRAATGDQNNLPPRSHEISTNNRSLVIKLTYKNIRVLFPGDIEKEAEMRLMNANYDLNADVLIAPHHGSATSNSSQFIKQVAPHYVLLSTGRYQRDKFPAKKVLKRYQATGALIFDTAKDGTISVKTNGEKLIIETFSWSIR